ncbi:SWIM zinc finger family protein [Halobellus sp. Atlit-31R]|nr:SWIM zinc finger family protein [Halobellus sp. Atlit-31R]
MTHRRNRAAPDAPPAEEESGASHRQRPRHRERTFPADGYEGRAYRARVEPMTVRPLRDGRYVVESEGGTYVVDAERATCTCPDAAIRGARCKHVQRVAIEIDAGLVPAPGERERVCAVCGRPTFAPVSESGPALCERHDHEPGTLVRDRETGALLVVVDSMDERADGIRTDEGRLVADYETNAAYGDHEPVFAVVYVESLPAEATDDAAGWLDALRESRRYLFPASRLVGVEFGRDGSEGASEAAGTGRRSEDESAGADDEPTIGPSERAEA